MNTRTYGPPNIRIGCLRLTLTIWRHSYATAPDRWVIQPMLIWDRRRQ